MSGSYHASVLKHTQLVLTELTQNMPRLSLNFAADQRSLTVWNPALWLMCLLAGVLALGIAAWDYQRQADMTINLQDRRDTLHRRTQRLHNMDTISSDVAVQIERANAAYALAKTPWEIIFTALETAHDKASGGIALLSIKADTTKRELAISGEAIDFTALSLFTSALAEIPIFQNVYLINDRLSTGNPPVVVTFDLRLAWRVNTTPE